MKILLVEPDYKNKYPPLGLMKISTYHQSKGDTVIFVKGKNKELKKEKWDRIYISTLFTFYWKKTIETIKYYSKSVTEIRNIYVGGVMATIMEEQIKNEFKGITIKVGLLDKPGDLGNDNIIVDTMMPDYSIIDTSKNKYLNYEYPTNNAYIAYATRGCIRKCNFCAVPIIEPEFKHYIDLKSHIEEVIRSFGERRNLLLLDNNILASQQFDKIIDDIIDLGFGKDNNLYTYKKGNRKISVRRYVDFNQGLDARLLSEHKMEQLSRIAINPARIAFDHADDDYVKLYTQKVRLAAKYKIKTLSNYILFNYNDTPEDLYVRLKINLDLNEEFKTKKLDTKVWSFPMRYSPIMGENASNRLFVGCYWNKKYIRAIQCILIPSHGVVGPNINYFNNAFGVDIEEFKKILLMPEEYIINREVNKVNGNIDGWFNSFMELNEKDRKTVESIVFENNFKNMKLKHAERINTVLRHYIKES